MTLTYSGLGKKGKDNNQSMVGKKYTCVMKRRHLMQYTGGFIPILYLRSTQVTIVRSSRETGNIIR